MRKTLAFLLLLGGCGLAPTATAPQSPDGSSDEPSLDPFADEPAAWSALPSCADRTLPASGITLEEDVDSGLDLVRIDGVPTCVDTPEALADSPSLRGLTVFRLHAAAASDPMPAQGSKSSSDPMPAQDHKSDSDPMPADGRRQP